MEFRILGPLEVRDGDRLMPLPRRRERALLAALLLRSGEVVSTDRLVEAIWGVEPPRTAVGSLQNAVSELRKVLGAHAVVTRSPGYVLAVDRDAIDAVRFERAVQRAAGLELVERAEALAGALALWRGPALADLSDEPFAQTEAARLDELRLAAIEDRIDADLALGRGADLVAEIESHVAVNPLRERLRGQLMLALYRSGRQAEALEAYQMARHALVDGLGIDPSQALQELERRILRQDPALLSSEAGPAALAEPGRVVGEGATRKTVTVLAAALDDVSGIDPEPLRARVDRFLAAVRDVSHRHGGTLDRFLGAEAVAVFGIPRVHEDDALRATRAAIELREALTVVGDTVRVGIATGEALAGTADQPVVGDVVAVATTLREAAPRDGILVADATFALTQDAVVVGERLTFGPRDLPARSLQGVQGAQGRARRLDTPFVGRGAELDELREALGHATGERRCVGVTVLGDAGIGKTRLAEELASSLVRGRIMTARCVPYGEGATFLPVLELVRGVAGELAEDAIARMLATGEQGQLAARHLAGLADPGATVPRGEAFWAVRLLLESLARNDPLVVVLDDVHWAEPVLLDLVEYLIERVTAPVLLVCLARPELLDERPGWAGATSGLGLVRLGPLTDDEAEALLHGLGEGDLDERGRRRIVERAEGNALHLEQLLAFVAEKGPESALESVPPTVEAVLASRVDGLSPPVRDTLQRAAVAGRELTRGIVVALSEPGAPVDAALLELTRRGLLHPAPAPGPDDAYSIHHALLRDVAYASLPKAVRAELHERAAAWLDCDGPGPDEVVGWHLEQAHRYRAELRPADSELLRLAEAAGERLARAAWREWRRSNVGTAVGLYGRAVTLIPATTPARARLECELGLALRVANRGAEAAAWLDSALVAARNAGLEEVEARVLVERELLLLDRGGSSPQRLEQTVHRGIPVLETAGDARGLSRAYVGLHSAAYFSGHYAVAIKAAERALHYYSQIDYSPAGPVATLTSALLFGPHPVDDAIERCLALLQQAGDRATEAGILSALGALHALEGAFDEADAVALTSRTAWEELGLHRTTLTTAETRKMTLAHLRGDSDAAAAIGRHLLQAHEDAGEPPWVATAATKLAWIVLERDDVDEAGLLVEQAVATGHPHDVLIQSLTRSLGGRVLARRGDPDAGRVLATEGIAVLADTDGLTDLATAWIALAEVELIAGRSDEAAAAASKAEAYCVAKRAPAMWAALRRLLGQAQHDGSPG